MKKRGISDCSSKEDDEEGLGGEESLIEPIVIKPNSKKKLSEVKRLKLSGGDVDLPRLRSQRLAGCPFFSCSSVSSWNGVSVGRVHVVSGQEGSSEGPAMDTDCLHVENDTYDNLYDNYDEIVFLIYYICCLLHFL